MAVHRAAVIEIRQLEAEDRRAWERMFRAYIDFYGLSLDSAAYGRTWDALLEDTRVHARAAWIDETMCGFAHFLLHPHTHANDVCYLQDLFTTPEARGQGVARKLIAYVTAWARARDCSSVYWQTHLRNSRARKLYDKVAEHRGFIVYEIDL